MSVAVEEYKGYEIVVDYDVFSESPRVWDNIGTMVCFHNRYDLGDKHDLSLEEAKELDAREDVISLPLYLYDHSGITMNTTGFSCPWDSGRVGFIYVTLEDAAEEYGAYVDLKFTSEKFLKWIENYLESEVKEYDSFLRGEVYGYEIKNSKTGEHEDSCWGFMGNDRLGEIIETAKNTVDCLVEKCGEQLDLFEGEENEK